MLQGKILSVFLLQGTHFPIVFVRVCWWWILLGIRSAVCCQTFSLSPSIPSVVWALACKKNGFVLVYWDQWVFSLLDPKKKDGQFLSRPRLERWFVVLNRVKRSRFCFPLALRVLLPFSMHFAEMSSFCRGLKPWMQILSSMLPHNSSGGQWWFVGAGRDYVGTPFIRGCGSRTKTPILHSN